MEGDPIDVRAIIAAVDALATADDVARLDRLTLAADTDADRAHLRLLVVRAQEEAVPGPPDLLEWAARVVVASMRGSRLYRPLSMWEPRDPSRDLPPERG